MPRRNESDPVTKEKEARKERARDLRHRIERVIEAEPAPVSEEEEESPRDFVHRRMRELGKDEASGEPPVEDNPDS